ncbi:MAG: ATP synthase F0 subunit C [Firmicutes bacterium]|nr:ATP synthase F0 subunit C [Bacillota bacterium]
MALAPAILSEANLAPIASAIAVFTGIGAGFGMCFATAKAVESIARQPEAHNKIRSTLIIGLALAETTAIYGAFIALMLIIL